MVEDIDNGIPFYPILGVSSMAKQAERKGAH
jgi:hypothetical protein